MVSYKLYLRDSVKGFQLLGVLPERRRNPKRITNESVLNWGRKYFGNQNPNDMFFVEVEINRESIHLTLN